MKIIEILNGKGKVTIFMVLTLFLLFNSCSPIFFDMRSIERPITMNDNPFVGDSLKHPRLVEVEDFYTSINTGLNTHAYGYGYNQVTINNPINDNFIQTDVFKSIGNDSTKVITNVILTLDTQYINGLISLSNKKLIEASGKVQKIKK